MIYILLSILIIIIIAGFVGLFYFINYQLKQIKKEPEPDQSLLMLNQNLTNLQERLGQINQELGSMKEIGYQMRSLQDFLKSPKLRGNIGEQVLKDLLEQYFPKGHFELQHKFKTGDRVDAILKTREGAIPIDSKFPVDNFQKLVRAKDKKEKKEYKKLFIRDVKKHVNDISKKYILPQEGTVDFAVMYIPSETVYYEIIRIEQGLDEYARDKRVHFVSPNSFYYFLRILMVGMRGQEIQENAKQILKILLAIRKDTEKLETALNLVTTHVNNAKNAVDRANTEYAKLTGKIDQVKLLK